ncbi:hypothetical protein SLEP1_g14224 [Rubroshorea leprosula]|uniref:Uncharacterized protein n=1 Tax=Rubroshorea leprosula TaxID=152421 RepID=A0AAV5IP56_9ROSI|nr:hypothetical protein SLEP1_g14224 [Rubroshorea leprosula]
MVVRKWCVLIHAASRYSSQAFSFQLYAWLELLLDSLYPTDVVNTVIKVGDYKIPKFSGSNDTFRRIRGSQGVKGLYKCFGPAMA